MTTVEQLPARQAESRSADSALSAIGAAPDIAGWVAYLGAVLAGLLAFLPVLPRLTELHIGFGRTDMKITYRHWVDFAVDSVRSGEIPLWNPFIYCGQPFMPSTHGTLFYPPNWPFLLPLPQPLSINLCILMQVAILATGTVYLARRKGTSNIGALLAGSLAALGSLMVCRVFAGHFTIVCTAAWIPWLLGVQDRLFRGERGALLPFALLGAVGFMGGHLQYAYYFAVVLGLSIFVHALTEIPRGGRLKWAGRQWLAHAGTGALALGLVAIEALPALDVAAHSMRSAAKNIQFLREFAMPPAHLVTAIAPDFFGRWVDYWGRWEWWEATFYFGVVGLVLCLSAALMRTVDRRRPDYLTAMFALCILIAVAGYLPVLPYLFKLVPGWTMFRGHNRLLSFAMVFGAVLAAHGFDALRYDVRGRATRTATWLFAGTVFLALALYAFAGPGFWRGLLENPEYQKELSNPNPLRSPEALAAAVRTARTSLLSAAVLAGAGLLLVRWGRSFGPRLWQAAVVGLAVLDVLLFAAPPPAFPPSMNTVPPKMAAFMASEGDRARSAVVRVVNAGTPEAGIARVINEGTTHRIPGVEGDDIVVTRYYNTFLCAYLGLKEIVPSMSFLLQGESPLLDAANLVYLGLDPDSPAARSGSMPFVSSLDGLAVFRRPASLPRAYVVGTAVPVSPDDAAIHRRLMEGIDFHSEVLLATDSDVGAGSGRFPAVAAEAEYRGLHEVRVHAPRSGFLVLADGYYPRWQATVAGKPVEVLRANGTFRAVPVSEGDEVIFRYRNDAFRLGALISGLTALAMAGWAGGRLVRGRRGVQPRALEGV